jgi:hypothetical protein
MIEVMVALGILMAVVIPLVFTILQDQRQARDLYLRAVVMEIVEHELGPHEYSINANSATNLPPGKFVFTRTEKNIRLEWRPQDEFAGRRIKVTREARLP